MKKISLLCFHFALRKIVSLAIVSRDALFVFNCFGWPPDDFIRFWRVCFFQRRLVAKLGGAKKINKTRWAHSNSFSFLKNTKMCLRVRKSFFRMRRDNFWCHAKLSPGGDSFEWHSKLSLGRDNFECHQKLSPQETILGAIKNRCAQNKILVLKSDVWRVTQKKSCARKKMCARRKKTPLKVLEHNN